MTLFGLLGLVYIIAFSVSLLTVSTLLFLKYQKTISFTKENVLLLIMAIISMISSWSYFVLDFYSTILGFGKIPAAVRVFDIWLTLILPFVWFIFAAEKVFTKVNKTLKVLFIIICIICLSLTFINYGLLLNSYYELKSWETENFVFTTEDLLAVIISTICLALIAYIIIRKKILKLDSSQLHFLLIGTVIMLVDGIQTFSMEYIIITNDAYIVPVVKTAFSVILIWYVFKSILLSQYQKHPLEVVSSDQILELIAKENSLTNQETVVAKLLYSGSTYKDIAEYLFISVHTVRRHASNIYNKINVSSKMELIQLVRETKAEMMKNNNYGKFS